MRRVGAFLSRRPFAAAFLGFFLLATAWSFAMPYDGPPDELQHVVRAYGVMTGQIMVPDGTTVTVPKSLAEPSLTGDAPGLTAAEKKPCMRWRMNMTAACAVSPDAVPTDQKTMTSTTTGAGTYNPFYYWFVGVPIKLWPHYTGIFLARLLTGAAMSALFAAAVSVAVRLGRGNGAGNGAGSGRLMLLGTIAAITPVSVGLSGAVNPAGLEIAAGVGLWAALIAIVYARDDSWRIFTLLGVSGILMAVLREMGIGWLLGSLAVAALGLRKDRMLELVRLRAFWVFAVLVFLAVLGGALWIVLSSQGGIGAVPNPSDKVPHGAAIWGKEFTHRVPYYTSGLVGLLAYGDVALPVPLIFTWFSAVGLLLVVAVRRCGRRIRLQLIALIVIPYAILILADGLAVKQGYWLSQGRYALPMLCGAPMLAGYALGRAGAWNRARQARMLRIAAVLLVPIQAAALWITIIRYQHGFNSLHPFMPFLFADTPSVDPFSGSWTPPLGTVLPVVLGLAGTGVLIWFLRVAALTGPQDAARPEPELRESGVTVAR